MYLYGDKNTDSFLDKQINSIFVRQNNRLLFTPFIITISIYFIILRHRSGIFKNILYLCPPIVYNAILKLRQRNWIFNIYWD